MRGRTYEVTTRGFDENLQLVGSDPSGGAYWTGLRIPGAPNTGSQNRYLLSLCGARFGAGRRVRLVGIRQLLTIGALITADNGAQFPLEQQVTSPFWKFTDGNVMWALRRVKPFIINPNSTSNGEGRQFQYGVSPALQFAVGEAPPFAGLPPGVALEGAGQYAAFYSVGGEWKDITYINCEFEGPCDIVFFASILQTDPTTRTQMPSIGGPLLTTEGVTVEDAFTSNFTAPIFEQGSTGVVYWRIAGSLIFEDLEDKVISIPTMRTPPPKSEF